MGARPLFVLNLVGFPRKLLPEGILDEILRGGSEVTRSVGVPTLGGHSIDDAEPKYGLVAIGEVDPAKMVTNAGARPGDRLILTKPIGSGVIATAIKKGEAPADVISDAVDVMATLNDTAAELMVAAGVGAATDVTGFGLLGHLRNLARSSGVGATIDSAAVPLMTGARALAEAGHIPGGSRRNLEDLADSVTFADSIDPLLQILLADAQTSGGMLICAPAEQADDLVAALTGRTPAAAVIGEVTEGAPGTVRIE
jgi:selenide,water dikinase